MNEPSPAPSASAFGDLPGERTMVLPDTWLRRLHPRRGGLAVPPVTVDDAAPAKAAPLLTKSDLSSDVNASLASPDSEPELVEAGRRYQKGDVDPLGAAVIAGIHLQRTGRGYDEVFERIVDAWIVERGLAFAACAFTELSRLSVTIGYRGAGRAHIDPKAVTSRTPEEGSYRIWHARNVARKLRALLAVAGDDEYEAAAARLADHRGDHSRMVMASYLMPTRQDWIEECRAALSAVQLSDHHYTGWLLWCAVSHPDQLDGLKDELEMGYAETRIDILATALEGVGPAVVPFLADALDVEYVDADARRLLLQALGTVPTDEAFQALVQRLDRQYVQSAVLAAARRFPVRALRLLALAASGGSGASKIAGLAAEILRVHVAGHPELVTRPPDDLPGEARAAIEALTAPRLPEVPAGELPPLLVTPPWTGRRKAAKPVVVQGLEPPGESSLSWADGERDEWQADHLRLRTYKEDWPSMVKDFDRLGGYAQGQLLVQGPEEEVRSLMVDWTPRDAWYGGHYVRPIVARFGLGALPLALRIATANPASWGGVLAPFLDAKVAALQANWLARLKAGRKHAIAWFGRHGLAAVPMLLPDALGMPGAARSDAEGALRLLVDRHGDEEVVAIARQYGDEAARAVQAMLATDPLEILPARIPKVADWADPRALPQVLLRDRGRALPAAATGHLLTMLAMSKPDAVYPGVRVVRELCDPESLAEFSWALFRAWEMNDAPSKDGWALAQLGWLGDDETVRRLTPVVRAWPGEGGHAKAVNGLDALAAIGTDVALMHLHGIAQKVKFKALRTRAQERIEQVAAELELTADQLADRLVPDFGLDADGSLTLDYGPRRFVVGFDEQLKPYVAGEDGKRRKALPKPGAKDDGERAGAEYKRFASLKKDVRTVASDQIGRLEAAMVKGRRWPLAEFREFFVNHPLVWHIARRLVWAAEHDGGTVTFRIAEDRTFADAGDEALVLPDGAMVGIPHPLNLGEEERGAWSEMFADYEILQPFPQLGRAVHTLTDEERGGTELTRFAGITVPVGKVLGLQRRGWDRGEPQDGGVACWMSRRIAPGRYAVLTLEPGIAAGYLDEFPEQKIHPVHLGDHPDDYRADGQERRFGDLDPVTASEILADLAELAEAAIR
ncbi:DUF4132 domain-containing protein [Actinomadura viridis]|uniref:DUF4132 domain-containing protein n=1 Tax=Actinomadura viridis TaxID=58110 RepID=A0A931GKZ6_9ACTN|nr:DUF4132 domain-containing protein [Actinomadura viridis]MBG6090620.1 hypothetical protein [Actinomadura viridis]